MEMADLHDLKILVVEDMQELLIFHRRWLTIEKAVFYGSLTGSEGIQIMKDHPDIEIVLLDMLLPDMHGLEVLSQLRQLNPDIPVVVCSGYNDCMDELQKYQKVKFISKPFVLPELKKAIAEMAGRQ